MNPLKIIVVPHTHWDREWYLPFQKFRYDLVKLIDNLLNILKEQDYIFMLDGQTIVLEDYFEVRPERKDELLNQIRKNRIFVGPWYLLPDEWLVGAESLLRNLEYSFDLATLLNIPLMPVGYLPDQFGHSSAIPQIIGDLTQFKAAVLWRGVPPDIMTVPFTWKSHSNAMTSILGIYMPGGYGNTSRFSENYEDFKDMVNDAITELEPFSPFPLYLLMNGSDHLLPQPFVKNHIDLMKKDGTDISLGVLTDYIDATCRAIENANYEPPEYNGEFRSPSRAPLLQNTYSARMWIKIWNQKIEDTLIHIAEPLSVYLWLNYNHTYPTGFIELAWKWLLRNHPHDSICGCSIDQTHEEMKSRFSWAESIAERIISDGLNKIQENTSPSNSNSITVFNPTNDNSSPLFFTFTFPKEESVNCVKSTSSGDIFDVQRLDSKEDVFLDTTVGLRTAKMGLKLIPGRKLMGFYINGVEYFDGEEPGLLEIRFNADIHPIGEFDMKDLKQQAVEIFNSGRYKKIHLLAARPTQTRYAVLAPLQAFAFTEFIPSLEESDERQALSILRDQVMTKYYTVTFNKDGTLTYENKKSGQIYDSLHEFEDLGDRGDEYTFGRVEPSKIKIRNVKREILANGPVIGIIRQNMILEVFQELDSSREKRIGKVQLPVESDFHFYRDSPRIEIRTRLTNTAKDHRLRINFKLSFHTEICKTETHFGYIERKTDPEDIPDSVTLEKTKSTYPELPSGIQPQKRYIRIDNRLSDEAITVFNKGLPEVEVVSHQTISLTLLRSIGWLSRSDYPERPMHAGPGEETPGAQDMEANYEFRYGFVIHPKTKSMEYSANQAEAGTIDTVSISLRNARTPKEVLDPVIQIDNPAIRISSIRSRKDGLLITLYNQSHSSSDTSIRFNERFCRLDEIRIDGSTLESYRLQDSMASLQFKPRAIKMCFLTS